MKYVWIEESPNTASDCGVAPLKKGDDLRSRRDTTRKVEEHFPRHVQGLGWRKSSRSVAGKTVWRADGDKNPQKRYVQGSDGRTKEVGRLVGVRRSWRRRGVAGKVLTRPHAPAREIQSPTGKLRVASAWMIFWFRCLHKSWRSPPDAPLGVVGVGKRRRRESSPAVSVFWRRSDWPESIGRWGRWPKWNTITGRFPGVDDTGNRKELGILPWLWYHVERERKKKNLNSHSTIYLQLRNIYI